MFLNLRHELFLYNEALLIFFRVLVVVDAADPLQLFLCVPSPTSQAEHPAAAEAERNKSDRLQRSLQPPFLHAGPQCVHLF